MIFTRGMLCTCLRVVDACVDIRRTLYTTYKWTTVNVVMTPGLGLVDTDKPIHPVVLSFSTTSMVLDLCGIVPEWAICLAGSGLKKAGDGTRSSSDQKCMYVPDLWGYNLVGRICHGKVTPLTLPTLLFTSSRNLWLQPRWYSRGSDGADRNHYGGRRQEKRLRTTVYSI